MFSLKSIFASKKISKVIPFLEKGEIAFHLGRAKSLLAEMQNEFTIYHIVETFWMTSDLFDAITPSGNMTDMQLNLLNAAENWSRSRYGFNRTEQDEPITINTIFVGGDLGYYTGLVPINSLQGLHTNTIAFYLDTDCCPQLEQAYFKLFIEVVSQFCDLLQELKNLNINL